MTRERLIVNSRYFDGSLRRSWECDLIAETDEVLTLRGTFDRTVEHLHLGKIVQGTLSYEYFWPGRWYNVFRFHHPDGKFRNFYCNISMPFVRGVSLIDYVDLDLDIIVGPTGETILVDKEDFARNEKRFGYPDEVCRSADAAVERLLDSIEHREFPFDHLNLLEQTG